MVAIGWPLSDIPSATHHHGRPILLVAHHLVIIRLRAILVALALSASWSSNVLVLQVII